MSQLTVSSLGERALIQRLTARLAMPSWVVLGPGDDAAIIEPERGMLDVLTTDAIVEGIHFDRRFVPLDAVGHRALAVNLSDLAAMGARPRTALLSLALPETFGVDEVDRLFDGLLAVASQYQVTLIGGNITRTTGPLMVDVTATGSVGRRRFLTRAGARAGDDVYVTGSLGAGTVGLQSLRLGLTTDIAKQATACEHVPDAAPARPTGQDVREPIERQSACEARYLRPEPRVRAGLLLGRNRAASSCMDLSDGLGDAAWQVADASGVGLRLDAASLPLAPGVREWHARAGGDALDSAFGASDDYELLFTVRPTQRGRLRAVRAQLGTALPLTRIGTVTKEKTVVIAGAQGTRPLPRGFDHFR